MSCIVETFHTLKKGLKHGTRQITSTQKQNALHYCLPGGPGQKN